MESDKEPSSNRRSGGQTQDRSDVDFQKLEAELEYLRRDRDEWRETARKRDQQHDQLQAQIVRLEQQWVEREKQWQTQRDGLSQQIAGLEAKITDLGMQLKVSQGIEPGTEKGATLAKIERSKKSDSGGGGTGGGDGNSDQPSGGGTPSHQKKRYLGIFDRHRAKAPDKDFDSVQAYWQSVGSDPRLIRAPAVIFGSRIFTVTKEDKLSLFTGEERRSLFGQDKGLHATTDKTTIYDLRLTLAEITCTQENLKDLGGTLYFRKGNALGPPGCQMSWQTLATVVTLVCEYAFPMERLAKAIGHSYFSSANISRWMIRSATGLVNVYIALGKALGNGRYFSVDDTSALVLALRAAARAGQLTPDKAMSGDEWEAYLDKLRDSGKPNAELLVPVIEAFGRVSQRADEEGAKLSVNVTLISGQLVANDYRSKGYFYRTHFGQAGNLLSRILEHRKPGASKSIVIQSDRSAQNQLEAEVKKHFDVTEVGCSAHGRRPIFRYRDRDEDLCYYLLRCFAALANIEAEIKRGPMTEKRILRYRQRYAAKIWDLIKGVCQAVIDKVSHPITGPSRWKKDDKLYDACLYVIRHFEALTYYLNDPLLEADNNAIEQGLRGEKLIESSALFRNSELGRIALDIHRSFIASCNACHLPYDDFIREVLTADPKDVAAHPEQYFPHVIARKIAIRAPPTQAGVKDTDSKNC